MKRTVELSGAILLFLSIAILLFGFFATFAEAQATQNSLCDRFPSLARRLPSCNMPPPPPPVDACPNVPGNQASGPCADAECVEQGGTWNGSSCIMPPPTPPPTEGDRGTRHPSLRADCVGGAITHVGGNMIHTFTSDGTLSCSGRKRANVLVVAGGGGGGGVDAGLGPFNYAVGGGGGAGGFKTESLTLEAGSYAIRVGSGGTGGSTTGTEPGGIGGDSYIGTLLVSHGGGGGGTAIWNFSNTAATNGGSGGGAGGGVCHTADGLFGTGIAGEGHNGGNGSNTCVHSLGAGGGGAGEVGHNDIGLLSAPGDGLGGMGLSSALSGVARVYAVGGNGGGTISPGATGAANTGNGGNGNKDQGGVGGAGGSGIVIVSYLRGD